MAVLDQYCGAGADCGWHLLHACRADLLRQLGRVAEADDAYRKALALQPPPAERLLISARLDDLRARDDVG